MTRVLVDMDGVLCATDQQIYSIMGRLDSKIKITHPDLKTEFYYTDSDPVYINQFHYIYRTLLHFDRIDPIEGAIDGIKRLAEVTDVWICTAHLSHNKNCASGKIKWIEKWLGTEWAKKVIITKGKHLVDADILIDDRPEMINTGRWEHVLYKQPYNIHSNKRSITWNTLEKDLPELFS